MSEPKEGKMRPVTPELVSALVDYLIACRALTEFLFLLAEEGKPMPASEERFKMLDQIFADTRAAWLDGIAPTT